MGTFALNFQSLYEINVTPEAATATWARLAAGITSADPSNNETVDQTNYLDGDGYASSLVIGAQRTIAFSGHRVYGDTAQDYIAGIAEEIGSTRVTEIRVTDAKGRMVSKECTVANIDFGGGDAAAKEDISFEIHLNGKPEVTDATAAAALSVVVAAGVTAGTTIATATAGVGNTLAYRLKAASAGTVYAGSYLESYKAYTSGAEIAASVGQYLQVYAIDANKRVVSFSETLLDSGDFPA